MNTKFITLENGLRLHYRQTGFGDLPILFVPGWTMTLDVFHRQFDYFESSTTHQFISFDPRSHGKSDITQEGNHYEQHGRDLHEFIEALNLDNIILCGWSFGTLGILSYINQFSSKRLNGLIMLDGPPRATSTDPTKEWATYSYDDKDGSQEFFTLGKLRNPISTNVEFARWMLEDDTDEQVNWITSMTNQTPNSLASQLNATAVFLDYRQELIETSKIIPIWCMVRHQRKNVVLHWCNRNLSNFHISAFGEHMMFWERSIRFNTELTSFLKICTHHAVSKKSNNS